MNVRARTIEGRRFDVAVAGGGAVGLAAAIGLARAGLDVALIGAVDAPQDTGRTAALMAPSVAFLDGIGVLDRLRPFSHPLAAMRLIDLTGALVRAPTVTFRASEIDLDWFALNFANADLVREMTAAFREAGGTAFASLVRAAAFEPDVSRLTMDGDETIEARLVIAADGQKSLLRAAAGIPTRTWSYPQTALTFHVTHTKDHEDTSTELHRRAGPLTFVPFGAFRSAVVWLAEPKEAERLRALSPRAFAIETQRASSSLLGDLELITPVAAIPMAGLLAERATGPRLALAGEALHAFPPIGAQGLNLGLRDARQAVETIVAAIRACRDPGADETLAAYESGRKADALPRTFGVDLLNRSLFANLPPFDLARAAGLTLASNAPPLRRLLMRAGMGEALTGRL